MCAAAQDVRRTRVTLATRAASQTMGIKEHAVTVSPARKKHMLKEAHQSIHYLVSFQMRFCLSFTEVFRFVRVLSLLIDVGTIFFGIVSLLKFH